jgi:hypothetical protein
MSSFRFGAFCGSRLGPVSALSGRKEFIENNQLIKTVQEDAVLSADTMAP